MSATHSWPMQFSSMKRKENELRYITINGRWHILEQPRGKDSELDIIHYKYIFY